MVRLTKRLQAIAEKVPQGSIAVDVGSDHGLLARYLLESQSVKQMFATEFKPGPYQRLRTALKGSAVSCYQADGLTQLPETVNTLVIAGMGGLLIASMIREQLPVAFRGTLVLCPHQDVGEVRRALVQKHFAIRSEIMLYEKKFYVVMVATPGKVRYTETELKYGPLLIQEKGPTFQRWIAAQIKACQLLLSRRLPEERKNDLRHTIQELNDLC